MPVFDLQRGVKARYSSGATPQQSYDVMKKIAVTFAKRGYQVQWVEQKPPTRLVAKLTDKEGTDLTAEIHVVDAGTVTHSEISIHGSVFLGGLLGRIVTASTIEAKAQDKIKEMLDEEFRAYPAKRAAPAVATPASAPAAKAPAPAAPASTPARTAPAPAPERKATRAAVLADKLSQVQEALDAQLIDESEAAELRLRISAF